MSKQAAFWDASALVPLCVQEASSRQAHTQLRKFMPVVWWGSPVEVHSAADGEKFFRAITYAIWLNASWILTNYEPRIACNSPPL